MSNKDILKDPDVVDILLALIEKGVTPEMVKREMEIMIGKPDQEELDDELPTRLPSQRDDDWIFGMDGGGR